MDIEYKVIESSSKKNEIKEEFQDFFFDVFGKKLDDEVWEHQFLDSPYDSSSLFLALSDGKIIGSALMIPQKLEIEGVVLDYYLYTTSAISKLYRPKGVYVKLLEMQREYCSLKNKAFILAFPNKLAYQVLKLFGGFKDLSRMNLVKSKLSELKFPCGYNSFILDNDLLKWRFEHKNYKFLLYKEHILIVKEFGGNLDVLAVYSEQSMVDMSLDLEEVHLDRNIVTLESFLKAGSALEKLRDVNATYFPVSDLNYNNININLLMSDVF